MKIPSVTHSSYHKTGWNSAGFWLHLHCWLILWMQELYNHLKKWTLTHIASIREKNKSKFHRVLIHIQNRVCVNDHFQRFQMPFIHSLIRIHNSVDINENYSSVLKKNRPLCVYLYTETISLYILKETYLIVLVLSWFKITGHTAWDREREMINSEEKDPGITQPKLHCHKLSLFSLTTKDRNWFLNFSFILNGNYIVTMWRQEWHRMVPVVPSWLPGNKLQWESWLMASNSHRVSGWQWHSLPWHLSPLEDYSHAYKGLPLCPPDGG